MLDEKGFRNFFLFYEDEPQQRTAVEILRQLILEDAPHLLEPDSPWVQKYREEAPPAPKPHGCLVTSDLMSRLTGFDAESFGEDFCGDFNQMLEATGFDQDVDAFRMLMANLMHESGNFVYMKEIDPGYYLEGRSDLGNTQPGDGPRFRGCGPLQVTGRTHHTRFQKWLKAERGIWAPEITTIGTDWTADHYPFQIAISWIQGANLLRVCQQDGFDACCKRINGGWNGIDDRRAKYEICKREIN